jgi:hypothetical protein
MPMVIITAQVQDPVKWEAGFRTRGDLFRTYTVRTPIQYTIAGKATAICMEPEKLKSFTQAMERRRNRSTGFEPPGLEALGSVADRRDREAC